MIEIKMGIQQVRLYTNTTSEVPATFTDVTSQFSGLDPNTVADEVASATITLSDIPPGTTVFAWIEAIDEAGNSSGIQPVGSATTKYLFAVPNQSITDSRGVTFDVYNVAESFTPYAVENDPTLGLTAFTLMFPILADGNYTTYPGGDRFNFNIFTGGDIIQIRYWAKVISTLNQPFPLQTVANLWDHMNKYHVFTFTSDGAGTHTMHLHVADGPDVIAISPTASVTTSIRTTRGLTHGYVGIAGRTYYVGGPRVFSRALTAAEIQTQAVDMLTP